MRVILHCLADYVRHLGVTAVVHDSHGVQDAPLDGLESVYDMRNGTVQDGIGRIVQIPLLEHP